jgi:hypothetical protein
MPIDPTPQTGAETPQATEAKGIFQSDLLIRAALIQGIRELRAHPYLLDYCFAHLVDDELTADTYGDRERQKAKAWFLRTDIPVVMDYRQVAPEGHQISVALVDSSQAETTLASVHYQPTESVESIWPVLLGPFAAASYNGGTGEVVLSAETAAELVVVPGMILTDRVGRAAEVAEVVLSEAGRWVGRFKVATGTQLDLTSATIKGARPALVQQLESTNFKEVYRVGAHALGEGYVLTWLHSIVLFILLRYEQALLEARGFERASLSSGPFAKDERWTKVEDLYTRFVTITGYARQSWPKRTEPRINSTDFYPAFVRAGTTASTFTTEPGFAAGTAPWGVADEAEDDEPIEPIE